MLPETRISRRGFLKTAGALTFSFTFAGRATQALAQEGASKFNTWVSLGADGTVTVMMPAAEMGQGVLTSLSLILAEELDADWSKVTTQYAPPIPKIYGNYHPLFQGAMLTAASVSTPGYWTSMRMGGAQARRVLLDNVAKQWNVPVSELTTEPSTVVHAASGRRVSYGDVVKFAAVPEQPPLQPVKLEPALATAVNVTCSPELKDAEQVAPQAMPAGALVTVPVPVPADVTISVFETAVAKAAVTVVAPVRETVQEVPDELVQPVQPVNVAPMLGAAVNVIDVPDAKLAAQLEPQSMPLGELVTVPEPEVVTVSV